MRLITKDEIEFNTIVMDRITMLEQRCSNYEKEMTIMKMALVLLQVEVECIDETLDDLLTPIDEE